MKALIDFIPWIILGFLPTHNLNQLSLAIAGILLLIVVFDYRHLRQGFVLAWGMALFFVFAIVAVALLRSSWVAHNLWVLSSATLAVITWISLCIGKPFTLQYAREQTLPEHWASPTFTKINVILTGVWGMVFSCNAAINLIKFYCCFGVPGWVYTVTTNVLTFGGVIFTLYFPKLYRNHKSPK